jgi:hypothetical protein
VLKIWAESEKDSDSLLAAAIRQNYQEPSIQASNLGLLTRKTRNGTATFGWIPLLSTRPRERQRWPWSRDPAGSGRETFRKNNPLPLYLTHQKGREG